MGSHKQAVTVVDAGQTKQPQHEHDPVSHLQPSMPMDAGLPATIGMDGRVMYPRVSDFPRYNME